MKTNRIKCIWIACIAVAGMLLSTAHATQLGNGYISNVTSSGGSCVSADTNGGGIQFWDIQAGGTYTITLSGVDDACNLGNDPTIGVVVHNSNGGNIYAVAGQVNNQVGVYRFTITLASQCLTMPIEYCTHGGQPDQPGNFPGTGKFAQDYVNGGAGGHQGHLRTSTFDENCAFTGEDTTCQGGCAGASITVCKYYDFNANGSKDQSEQGLANWPFCLSSVTNSSFAPLPQTGGAGGCTTFSDLPAGTYIVTEGSTNGWFNSTHSAEITIDHCGQDVQVSFGNYCTQASGGLTLGFWSNKNGNKLLTGDPVGAGRYLLANVVTLLNGCQMRNANGSLHTFTNDYNAFKSWLLSANATNMAYMLSAQLAALKLDVYFNKVDGNAYDMCSSMTVNALNSTSCDQLAMDGNTVAGNPTRLVQESLKNCIDAINNNGPVVPVTPCDHAGASVLCGQ